MPATLDELELEERAVRVAESKLLCRVLDLAMTLLEERVATSDTRLEEELRRVRTPPAVGGM